MTICKPFRHSVSLAALVACAWGMPVHAQTETARPDPAPVADAAERSPLERRAEQVVALINGEIAPDEMFTEGFLAAVPPAQLAAISAQLTGQFGRAIAVEQIGSPEATRSALAIRMERAIARGGIAIDPTRDDRVSELLFQTFEPLDDSPEKIEADLAALPGEVSWYFGPIDGGAPLLANDPERAMPLGSTFKLYVLAALAHEIARGERAWDDVVALPDRRSFPSGMMQDWPQDAPVTLATLASLMIAISDNTATDALIAVLGRDAVYRALAASGHSTPEANAPFLTTREMFLLKGGPTERLEAYRVGDEPARRAILDRLEEVALATGTVEAAFSGGPVALDVEWFASAADLAALFRWMRANADPFAFEIMAINPSMPVGQREKYAYAGYKGGSEPGVLNLTWLVQDRTGRDHVLVLSWRDPERSLDTATLELIGQRILSLPL